MRSLSGGRNVTAGKCACKRARLCGVRTGQSDAHAVLQQAAGSSDITCGALDQCLVLPEEVDDLASMRLKFVTVYCTVQRHDILERDRIYRLQHMRRGS